MPPRAPRPATPSREADPLRVVQAAIQSLQFAPVYYLFGDDEYLKEAAQRDLLAAAIDPSTRDFNSELRQAGDLSAEALGSLLATPPMMADRRAVVLRDVTQLKKEERKVLDRYLERPASDTLLLLVSPAGTTPDAALVRATTPLDFALLSPERVRRWIAHHAGTVLSMAIDEEATVLLQQVVGQDLQQLAAELDKCASHALSIVPSTEGLGAVGASAPARITVESVSAVVGVRRGETVTDLLDAVARQDAKAAVALVGHVLNQPKMSGVQIVMMLSTQQFALAYGRARRDAGVPASGMNNEYFTFLKQCGGFPGRPWGEATKAWALVTEQWSAAACARALALLLEADMALKDTTVSNEEQTVMTLVLSLCALRRRAGRAA